MPPQLATLLVAIGIAGLFWLDRDESARPSKALWLAVIWLGTAGSRPVSAWLGMSPPPTISGQLPQTSLLDQVVAGALMLLGIIVVVRRRADAVALLKASWPILLYFSFALISLSWSDFPGWGLKRWVRALGDVVMALIVVTDAQPAAAFRRLYSRLGFILLPLSLLFIKYYPKLGRGYDPWGGQTNTGVTTNKNILGVVVFVLALGTVWQVLALLRDRERPNRRRRLLAQGTLLAFGSNLLFTAHSATAGVCFVLGAGLMVAIALPLFRRRPQAVHALVLAVLLSGGVALLLGAAADLATATGRSANLSGRTEIWKLLIPMAPNPIGGAGFETFWAGPRYKAVETKIIAAGGYVGPNEAHNGYIEVYLNLGWIGVGLIALILGQGYRRAVGAFRHDPALGALLVAYIVTAVTYNITEAGFRMLDLPWFFLVLSVVAANRVISLGETAPEPAEALADPIPAVSESDMPDLKPTWMDSWRPVVSKLETRN